MTTLPNYQLTDDEQQLLDALEPRQTGPRQLYSLLHAERQRRLLRDGLTGVHNLEWLRQGQVARAHFRDRRALSATWRAQAIAVDVRSFKQWPDYMGLQESDALLVAIARTLEATFPKSQVFRFQGDAFGVVFPGDCGFELGEGTRPLLLDALKHNLEPLLPADRPPRLQLAFTIALLDLTLVQPYSPRDVGNLLWSECDRAYEVERLHGRGGIQRRRIELAADLDGK